MADQKTAKAKFRVSVTMEDMEGKTKEVFKITADEAFAVQTLFHSLRGTAPSTRASWIEACKAADMSSR